MSWLTHREPGDRERHLAGGDWQEGLIDFVNADIVDLRGVGQYQHRLIFCTSACALTWLMPTMYPLPQSRATRPRTARGTSDMSINPGFSDSARTTTYWTR